VKEGWPSVISHSEPSLSAQSAIESAAGHYYFGPVQAGIDNRVKRLLIERCLPHVQGPRVLDLGYIDGTWTDALLDQGHLVDIVEGAASHVAHALARYAGHPHATVFRAMFETFEPAERYDTVVAGDMLGCIDDPVGLLGRAAGWLRPGGVLVATVPNSRSLHRRVGSLMEIESTPAEVNPRYRSVGNRWSYDRYLLRHQLAVAGFEVEAIRGCFLKPLPSDQIEGWDDRLLRAFLDVGDELQDYCYYLYGVGRIARA